MQYWQFLLLFLFVYHTAFLSWSLHLIVVIFSLDPFFSFKVFVKYWKGCCDA